MPLVLANGLPYLLGTERNKGSHSMSGYHSFELCYLAAVYTNLLITKQPLDLYFKPMQGGFKDNILRVAPDLLPDGSIQIESVTVDGEPYNDFDAKGLTVKIPASADRPKIRVRITPTEGVEHFTVTLDIKKEAAKLTLTGDLDSRALPFFRAELDKAVSASVNSVVMDISKLDSMASSAVRAIMFAIQKLDLSEDVVIKGANPAIKAMIEADELSDSVSLE